MASLALSFDIGGTFTDFVVIDLESGELVARHKVLTNTRAPADGVLAGWRALLDTGSVSAEATGLVVHSTTLVTNASGGGRSNSRAKLSSECKIGTGVP